MVNPHNIDAERAVLGAALTSPQILVELIDLVNAPDFYQPRHEAIWDAAVAIHNRGDRPDPVLVSRELGGGPAGDLLYLHELTTVDVLPVPSQAPHYAHIVTETATARRLVEAADAIRRRVTEASEIEAAVEDSRRILDDALSGTKTTDVGISAGELLDATIDALDSEAETGLETGWPDLDHDVNGLRAGQLCIVGARPSVGKSVIAANIAAHACKQGVGVHFASLEMTRREVMNRLLSAHASVNLSKLFAHTLDESDWSRIPKKGGEIREWPLWVDDRAGQSLAQLKAGVKRTQRRHPLGLIVVDYLQLMAPRDRRAPREVQVGELSEGLKVLAKESGVPVVALAQVNRGPADRTDKRPMMSDLRESGRIEADADHVWLLHRQDLVDQKSTTGELEVIVAKNRNGVAGKTVVLNFQGHYSRAVSRAWSPTGAIA